jgi:hypothetical protein
MTSEDKVDPSLPGKLSVTKLYQKDRCFPVGPGRVARTSIIRKVFYFFWTEVSRFSLHFLGGANRLGPEQEVEA